MSQSYPTADFITTSLSGAMTAVATTATIGTGLDIPAADGVLQIDYDSTTAVGSDNGPETIYYTAYVTGTGALTGITRGQGGTTGVAHANAAKVQCGTSSVYWQELSTGGNTIVDWNAAGETWTYASATTYTNGNTTYGGTFTITGDKTTKYSAGMKIRFVQTTTKYAIITKVSYSSPNTTVTIFLGTDYSLANAAINNPYYATTGTPFGFPISPSKWLVQDTSSTNQTTASAVSGTWYNAESITIPLGVWDVGYRATVGHATAASSVRGLYTTLSTANNSESDEELSTLYSDIANTSKHTMVSLPKTLTITADDIYYLNYKGDGTMPTNLGIYGATYKTIINAYCAYL